MSVDVYKAHKNHFHHISCPYHLEEQQSLHNEVLTV